MRAEEEPLLGSSSVALAPPAAADPAERPADFALILTDVSTYRSSKAKSFLRSLWLLGPAPARDEQALLQLLAETLGRAGFRVVRPPPGLLAADSPDSVTLLLTGTDARLQREHYREQVGPRARTRRTRATRAARTAPTAARTATALRVDPLALPPRSRRLRPARGPRAARLLSRATPRPARSRASKLATGAGHGAQEERHARAHARVAAA